MQAHTGDAVMRVLILHKGTHTGDSAPNRPSCHLAYGMTSNGDCSFNYNLSSLATLAKAYIPSNTKN